MMGKIMSYKVPGIVFCRDLPVPEEFLNLAEEYQIMSSNIRRRTNQCLIADFLNLHDIIRNEAVPAVDKFQRHLTFTYTMSSLSSIWAIKSYAIPYRFVRAVTWRLYANLPLSTSARRRWGM